MSFTIGPWQNYGLGSCKDIRGQGNRTRTGSTCLVPKESESTEGLKVEERDWEVGGLHPNYQVGQISTCAGFYTETPATHLI